MKAASRRALVHRFARLFALLAILAYQPLAALHFASDEAHLSHAATSIQVATHGEAHRHFGHPRDGHSHGDHSDPLCEFCILAGVSLPPLPLAPAFTAAEHGMSAQTPAESLRAERRLRIGHPVRAPPRIV